MLKQLFTIFKKGTLLDKAFKQSYEMLSITHDMFSEAKKSLREKCVNQICVDVYDKDIEVNKYISEVRTNILKHLTVAGSEEVYSGLVLVSIIIDIERIGDYTKNMIDLANNHPAKLEGGVFEEDLQRIEIAVENTFSRVPKQFEKSDTKDAEKLIEEYHWVNKVCDQRAIDYIKEVDKTVSSGEAVSLALYYRFLKRTNSHLRNIATSVINPFDQIGFTRGFDNKGNIDID